MSRITVHLQVGAWPSPLDRSIALPLDEELVRDAWTPIDVPSLDADPFIREIACTGSVQIVKVRETRERMAQLLAKTLVRALLASMEAEDTYMGYRERPGSPGWPLKFPGSTTPCPQARKT
jgi:hypothetical protein